MKLETTLRFTDGKPTIVNRRQFDSLTRGWNGEYEAVISKKRKKRSSPQNRYYYGVIVAEIQTCLIESQGEWINAETVHEFLKMKFNPKQITNQSTGDVMEIGLSTTELTTLQFEEFLDRCRQFALEFFGCEISLPNEQKEMAL